MNEVLKPWFELAKPRAVNLSPWPVFLSAMAVIMAFSTAWPPLVKVTALRPLGASGKKVSLTNLKKSLPAISLVVRFELMIAESID